MFRPVSSQIQPNFNPQSTSTMDMYTYNEQKLTDTVNATALLIRHYPTLELSDSLYSQLHYSIYYLLRGQYVANSLAPEIGYHLAFSGGKDSQVLLDICKRIGIRYTAYYNNTTIDPPDNIYFIRDHYPEVRIIHPKRTFLQLIEVKGLPTVFHRFCCDRLKEGSGAGRVLLTGVRSDESATRAKYTITRVHSRRKENLDKGRNRDIEQIIIDNHQCIRGKDRISHSVLLGWSDENIREYHEVMKLPRNPCYARSPRVGCMFCPYSRRGEIEYWFLQYPRWRTAILKALQTYLDNHPTAWVINGSQWSAEQCLDFWLSKQKLDKYLQTH